MNYHKIEKHSIANGFGIRVVLWCSGCSLHCKGCHNPQTWDTKSGILFDAAAKKELMEALSKSYIKGITFSGGHPLEDENIEVVWDLLQEIRQTMPEKDIWLFTGWTWEYIMNLEDTPLNRLKKEFVKNCDVVIDGPYKEEVRNITLKFRGSENQRVIDVKSTLDKGQIVLYDTGESK